MPDPNNPYNVTAPVNNAGLDPIQGFDIECWAQDSSTGKQVLFGRFQTITISVRNATETYLELGQRIPTYLDGEVQIAWVLEQGLLDMDFLTRTFGVTQMRRDKYVTRGPRFHISFDANAAEIESVNSGGNNRSDASVLARLGETFGGDLFSPNNGLYTPPPNTTPGVLGGGRAFAAGRIELMRCKVDSVSMGAMAGRRVVALRWEGVCEGYTTYKGESVQNFKTRRVQSVGLNSGTTDPAANVGRAIGSAVGGNLIQ